MAVVGGLEIVVAMVVLHHRLITDYVTASTLPFSPSGNDSTPSTKLQAFALTLIVVLSDSGMVGHQDFAFVLFSLFMFLITIYPTSALLLSSNHKPHPDPDPLRIQQPGYNAEFLLKDEFSSAELQLSSKIQGYTQSNGWKSRT
ncbi:unnamed protein product [Lactuca virosa]|uniref:Uncharacterized protein n=1 Tax=Lactuca virosa TaxID=75947 RepID=A0AAU9MSW2_9ASTR|nr:unnamed protein product [Lactuca virosa]